MSYAGVKWVLRAAAGTISVVLSVAACQTAAQSDSELGTTDSRPLTARASNQETASASGGILVSLEHSLDSPQALDALSIKLTNQTHEDATVSLWVNAAGLDQRNTGLEIGQFTVPAGGNSVVKVPVDKLPIQSVGSASLGHFSARSVKNGRQLRSLSRSFGYDFAADYRSIQFPIPVAAMPQPQRKSAFNG